MKRRALFAAVSLALSYAGATSAADPLVRFEGGIGVHPVANTGVVNTVKGVAPGGRPWAIQKLKANIKQDGSVSISGEGLVLAATDAIGTRGGVLQVAAQLFCGAESFVSSAADLSVGGNFDIRGMLSAQPAAPCASPVLLIRNATGGTLGGWFAAGTLAD